MKVLQLTPLHPPTAARLRERFTVIGPPGGETPLDAVLEGKAAGIGGIATTGKAKVDAALIDRLPNLRVIACFGAGTEHVDIEAAKARGIAVTSTGPALAGDVADLAIGMLIALFRRMLPADGHVRSGLWQESRPFPLGRSLFGARLGIVGLGGIGKAVATRAQGFGMEIGYTGPRRKPDAPFHYEADPVALALWANAVVLTCPGGPATRDLADARFLDALGPEGYLVNVARGSVVDEAALIDALAGNRIAGAGLDVFISETDIPQPLRDDPRVVLAPHMASGTDETRHRMGAMMIDALATHLLEQR